MCVCVVGGRACVCGNIPVLGIFRPSSWLLLHSQPRHLHPTLLHTHHCCSISQLLPSLVIRSVSACLLAVALFPTHPRALIPPPLTRAAVVIDLFTPRVPPASAQLRAVCVHGPSVCWCMASWGVGTELELLAVRGVPCFLAHTYVLPCAVS